MKKYEVFYHFRFCILDLFMDFKKTTKRTNMIEVLSKQEILNLITNNSRYQISKVAEISEQTLSNYANGVTDVGRMSYNNAIKLTQYAKENNL